MITTTQKHVHVHCRLGVEDLMRLAGVPEGARNLRVFVPVPGGGDWSNTSLIVGEDTPGVTVEWDEVLEGDWD